MGNGGKDEVSAPKSTVTSDHLSLGKLRFQVYGRNETHVHDDEKKLVFIWSDCQAFRLAMESFIKNHSCYPSEVAVRSDKAPTGSGQKQGDLLLKNDGKQWSLTIEPAGVKAESEIVRDATLEFLDNFIQRY